MLLEITTTQVPATDLGYLLHKNPARVHTVGLAFGSAHVFYPEASEERCTAALMLDVDSVGLTRGRDSARGGFVLQPYVNDRPYAASSFLSVAISRALGSALNGKSKERQALADTPIPLEARIAALPCGGGETLLRRLFEPLGWTVEVTPHRLDDAQPEWGESRVYGVSLSGVQRLADLLAHVYVLVPVLDDEKHYWVGDAEVEKLLRHGERWLATHPERELVTRRYLRHQRKLVSDALRRLCAEDAQDPAERDAERDEAERSLEQPIRLNDARIDAVLAELAQLGARKVIDLGCGEGRLLKALLRRRGFDEIAGVDVSHRSLERAAERLDLERMPEAQRKRVRLIHGSLVYRDDRFTGFDAATLVEVIEHLDPFRLGALERVVFEHARPTAVVLTTPNVEHNVRFEGLRAGKLRHPDHRFEWTRAELAAWARGVGERFGYRVRLAEIGQPDPDVGAPTQMAVFTR
jgi:3' terminal RNA ribose 2'-O-methyltransferase Hen1